VYPQEKNKDAFVRWPELIQGKLVRRYKRFLADIELADGKLVTAHCPNSGRMKFCSEPGRRVYISTHNNPKRKLKYTWELIEMPTSLVGVNTLVPNRLVYQSIKSNAVPSLWGYDSIRKEAVVNPHCRLDLLLENEEHENCWVEIKNSTMVEDGNASFPDAVTARGLKHLVEMEKLLKQGDRCVMFYRIQRMDATTFNPADEIDPAYGRELRKATQKGLEVLVYDVSIDLSTIRLNRRIPYQL
jgi:sugar fermentation stimulation protein A